MAVPENAVSPPQVAFAALLGLVAAGCAPPRPRTAVHDLNWACGERRCSVSFRLENAGSAAEDLAVRVRAYAGDSVQERRIVGEQTERLRLTPRAPRRLTVSVDTAERAGRVRVLLEFDER